MQIRKQKGTSPAHLLPLEPRHRMPTSRRVGRAITSVGRKWNIAGRRKEPKLKRILLLGYRLSLFSSFHSWLGVVLCDERGEWMGGIKLPPHTNHNAHLKREKKGWGCFPRGHRGCPNINYTFVHLWLTLGWPRLTPEWKRSSKTSPLPWPIPRCQQTAHRPLTHCQPNETSALMKPLWALLVRQQRAMKTPTIHFMDWAVVRTDNTGLINETGLVSCRERRGYKSATGDGIHGEVGGLVVSCWWGEKT